jgi:hypothetical protein
LSGINPGCSGEKNLRTSLSGFLSLQREFLKHVVQIIEKIEAGELSFKFHLEKLEDLVIPWKVLLIA